VWLIWGLANRVSLLLSNIHNALGVVRDNCINAIIKELLNSDFIVDCPWDNLHASLVCASDNILSNEWDISWGIWGLGTWGAVDRAEDTRADALGGSNPVTLESAGKINVVKPWVRAVGFWPDGGGVEEGDERDVWPLLVNANKGAPVEGLDRDAFVPFAADEDWDEVVDILFDWKGLGWGGWGELSLEIDVDVPVAVAVDEVEDFLKCIDASSSVHLNKISRVGKTAKVGQKYILLEDGH
jgi:hypothetical protein